MRDLRRRLAGTALLAAALPAAALLTPAASEIKAAAATPERPNIIVIMVDDMRDDDLAYMPRTRRLLGGQGVRFVNSFSPYPLCCPARASVLTGLYTHNHRVYDVDPPYAFPSFRDGSTIATWLQDAGYATVYLGKYLNGYGRLPEPGAETGTSVSYVPPGWTSWRASIDGGLPESDPLAGGTYQFFDTTLSRDGEGFDNFAGEYQTQVYGRLTAGIVRDRSADEAPYFLHVSYTAPHHGEPREADDPAPVVRRDGRTTSFVTPARPERVKGRFDATITAAPGASWRDPDITDKPRYIRRLPRTNAAERAALLEVTRQRAEALWEVDRQVRRTVRAIEASGEAEETLVLFTSDNGYYLGEQRIRQGKVFPHEPSIRVPLLLRGPGVPAGEVREDPITSIDLAPTLAAFAGITPPAQVDGVSMVDVARGGDRGWTRAVLTETGRRFGERRLRYAIGVRTPRWLYVDLATGERELYNVRADPEQYHNRAGDPAYAEVQSLLARVLRRTRGCDGAECAAPLPPELTSRR